ncbi:hypothetical protein [Chrysiogenes arsenatis]|uniref:hypothetical protein n=1 Tax=Chrysiogenes arsenatis TaxID=309797 RepID=UPI00041C50D5|nr:hypothetical protein [Chrysiogenes arsenatis]
MSRQSQHPALNSYSSRIALLFTAALLYWLFHELNVPSATWLHYTFAGLIAALFLYPAVRAIVRTLAGWWR